MDSLCVPCRKAFAINDSGGSVQVNYDGTPSLDVSTFVLDEWQSNSGSEYCSTYRKWPYSTQIQEEIKRVAVFDETRTGTPPILPELMTTTCPFCRRLGGLFLKKYGHTTWWRDGTAPLKFQLRFEWEPQMMQHHLNHEHEPPALEYCLNHLAVIMMRPHLRHPRKNHDRCDAFHFLIGALPGSCREWLHIKSNPIDHDGAMSKSNVNLVESWISECIREDFRCRDCGEEEIFIPKRLLSFGDELPPGCARLINNADIVLQGLSSLQVRYASLSYCWGSSLPLRTTVDCLEEHTSEMIISHMPIVFQEAILVARALGLRYLWIDALCIIQDSTSDWEQQSGAMGDIFGSSFVTICAATSNSCNDSFLARPTCESITIPFQSTLRPDVSGTFEVSLECRYVDEDSVNFESCAWSQRGWVWQEEMMSRRLLIFGKRMLQMKCRTTSRQECGTWGTGQGPPDDSYGWAIMMGEYSGRRLTFSKDKLIAIAGVAKHFSRQMQKKGIFEIIYLAGLWLESTSVDDFWHDSGFLDTLMWDMNEREESMAQLLSNLTDPQSYRAPSWSWASRDGGISGLYQELGWYPIADVVRYDMISRGGDPTVQLEFGSSLTLRGKLTSISLAPPSGPVDLESIPLKLRQDKQGRMMKNFGHVYNSLDWNNDTLPEGSIEEFRYFVLKQRKSWTRIRGLVLWIVQEPDHVKYLRVGTFRSTGPYTWLKEEPETEVIII